MAAPVRMSQISDLRNLLLISFFVVGKGNDQVRFELAFCTWILYSSFIAFNSPVSRDTSLAFSYMMFHVLLLALIGKY